ncbi:Gfo/Idh/MocA family protein [Tundrisphaera sp. TA3]|uniref:Gfo/Idh/MocA family protein n=1 Tax=Tundrisphaera sp. TA3 TaxID=3435775 RepID=UPI003EB863B4
MDASGKTMGLLVVGTGFFGSRRAAAARLVGRLRLVAVTDRDPASAERLAARHGVVAVPDLSVGLESGGVDAVVIATPHSDHAEAVRLALEAGKHVLCEKPLAIRAEDARELALLADESRLRLATGFNHRFDPPVADALAMAASGAIGRVESVRAEIGHFASPGFLQGWYTEFGLAGGGTLMDNGLHACDLIRRFLGEIVLAKGFVRQDQKLPPGCESDGFGLFRNHDDGIAELRSSWRLRSGHLTIDVRGSEGELRVETAPWRLSGRLADGTRVRHHYLKQRAAERVHRIRFGCERSIVQELNAFAAGSSNSPRPAGSGWDGCRATEMVQAIYQSDRTGDEIVLKPLLAQLPAQARRRAIREHRR